MRERSKVYIRTLHSALLTASVVAFAVNLGALAYFNAFYHWSVVLYYVLTNGVPALYYYNRIADKAARVLYFAETPAGTKGWVANDALPLMLFALSVMLTGILIRKASVG